MYDQEALNWEQGCRTDQVRNRFIIPAIIKHFNALRPARILDIGCGTGYVPRTIDAGLSYRPHWTLLDINEARLKLSDALCPDAMQHSTMCCDVTAYAADSPFDAATLTYTMMEIPEPQSCLSALAMALSDGASLFVALPDSWEDVAQLLPDEVPLRSMIGGRVELPKTSKFTGTSYPFWAIRVELAVELTLRAGFVLTDIVRSVGCSPSAYLLQFTRSGSGR
jgi:trans-aconitate methyltransferase